MKRHHIIQYKESLEKFIYQLRYVIWVSLAVSLLLFISSIIFLYNKMLLSAAFTATVAYLSFRMLWSNAIIITKKWVRSRGGQEEMLHFLDKEMKGTPPREFFHLLERAIKAIDR